LLIWWGRTRVVVVADAGTTCRSRCDRGIHLGETHEGVLAAPYRHDRADLVGRQHHAALAEDVIDLWAASHHLDSRGAALDLVRTFGLEAAPARRTEKRDG